MLQLYKPWELRPEEEDRIDDQVSRAQAQIDRELDEAQSRQMEDDEARRDGRSLFIVHLMYPRLHSAGSAQLPAASEEERNAPDSDANAATTESERATKAAPDGDATATSSAEGANGATTTAKDATESTGHPAPRDEDGPQAEGATETEAKIAPNHDEHDDHVVEGEEDTVIY